MNQKALKLLAIGGSNTRMTAGYLATTRRILEANGFPIESFRNLALGANTCVMGLISLAVEPDLGEPDVVVIEYAVNDYALMVMKMPELWFAAYEGLVRQVADRWPNALICCVILSRLDSSPDLWDVIADGTRRIVDNYPTAILVDCPDILNVLVEEEERVSLYQDPLHYNPTMQAAAGTLVASMITAAPDPKPALTLPAPISSDVLFPVQVIDFASVSPEQKETFKNSAVQADSLKISPGGSISIDVPGRLVAISFISRPDGGSFVMQWNGLSAVVHTLHEGVRDGIFPFLPLSAVGNWWQGVNESGTLTIETLDNPKKVADWPIFHVDPAYGSAAVYLHQALVRVG